ncbi:hypothetical protein [Geodermatophilus sp. SYSU D00696]
MRRSAALVALTCGAWALAAPASAQEPTIVTNLEAGTFTSSLPGCSTGTFVDVFLGGGGAFRSGKVSSHEHHAFTVRKIFSCEGGTFTVIFHPQITNALPSGCEEAGPFAVIGGTGVFDRLSGQGDFCLVPVDGGTETFTGSFRLD